MHSYTTSRALQQERYLRQAKERRSGTDARSEGHGLRKLLTMVAAYRLRSRSPSQDLSGRPSKVGLLTIGAAMALALGLSAANWPESSSLEITPSLVGDRVAEAQLAQHAAKVTFLTEQHETRSGADPLRMGPKSPLTTE